MADTEFDQLIKIGSQRNPVQESRYRELKSQGATSRYESGGNSGGGSASGLNTDSILKNAQAINEFNIKQNQPVIASYESSKVPLKQRYDDLISSLKGSEKTAIDRQTLTTNNELARRGIGSDSGVYQQEVTNAVNPITERYAGMVKDTTNQQNMDFSAIDQAIARLKSGAPMESVNAATGIQNAILSADQWQQSFDAQQKQLGIENALREMQFSQPQTAVVDANGRRLLINQVTGEVIRDIGSTTTGSSGGGIADLMKLFGAQTEAKPSIPVAQMADGRIRYSDGSIR